ncbi:PilN domain-containing protein [Alicyclobacillus fastidiosus]|uniref:PilN domain-containing protein n=1 Tax=Alicyclobacillus fastidiosus TaxID=392011 RepID=A0ABY6ZFR3_9BACL|nr:PilN domain-containing protein [Alicyclobacillus fastidiosus]WAH41702.1 PilN domain-containing protein [Alicyclobacillus fastidiosus]GMA63381.1 hypothetical protein GCM10025859_38210 [Alicyclobacillus fastidiosus]
MDINLLPSVTSRRPYRLSGFLPRGGWLSGTLATVAVLLLSGSVAGWIDARADKMAMKVSQLTSRLQNLDESQGSGSAPGTNTQLGQSIQSKAAGRLDWSAILQDIAESLPLGMTVDSINGVGTVISVSGSASSLANVADFEAQLSAKSWVASVTVQAVMDATTTKAPVFVGSGDGAKKAAMAYTYSLSIVPKQVAGGITT